MKLFKKIISLFSKTKKEETKTIIHAKPLPTQQELKYQKNEYWVEKPNSPTIEPKSIVNIEAGSLKGQNINPEKYTEAVIGFDFGSSSSKVVVNFPTTEKQYAIDFDEYGHRSNPFLFPTVIYIDNKGNLSLDKSQNSKKIKDFKIKLIDVSQKLCFNEYQFKYRDIAIAYIGLVLRAVKEKVAEIDNLPSGDIKWQLNLGIPSASHNDKEMMKIFRNVACSAWFISESNDPVNLKTIHNSTIEENWNNFIKSHKDNINVVSEIAAEVIGYAKSSDRRDGLYVLIDIGSRTLDISSFNLFKNDVKEDKYAFLTANIQNLGTYYLHEERIKRIKEISLSKNVNIKSLTIEDSVTKLPDFTEYFDNVEVFNPEDEVILLDEFYNKCRCFLCKTFVDLKQNRYPMAPEWEKGLPVFICGGGKSIPFYKFIIKIIERDYIINQIHSHFIEKQILIPELKGYYPEDKDRMAVAYGLSHNIYNIGEIRPPADFEDINCVIEDDENDLLKNIRDNGDFY